ncbi:acyl-CoA dehydrogenase [Kitasatospora sp. NPDC101183]|uniref:acyl-CoA dehydrogenase n=1 Tax=Kitasatospora sp. NPDC101183 TaxID=3364100 RepID=UPI003800EC15
MNDAERIARLERAFGSLFSADNPLGQHALLAADARGEVLAEAECQLDAFGLNAEFVPAEHGGRLTRLDVLGRILRPVFRRDASLGFGYGLNCFFAVVPVWTGGDAEQREKAARMLLDGRRIAVVRHEVAHGNAFVRDEFEAREVPGGFVLNGTKAVIANASRSAGLVVFARTGGENRSRAHSVLLLDRGELPADRFEDLDRHTTSGMRSAEFGGLRVTDCEVPANALVGGLGDGYELSLRSSLVIRGLIPSIVLAGGDTALRTVVRFATRRRDDGRSSLDVQHCKDVLAGAFLDLLVADCLALVATRALHLLPKQMSAYAATAAYLAPKLISESMDEMSTVLGKAAFAEDGAYGMFQKQLRDLPVTSLGHAGSAGRQVSILPQLPFFARHAWFADPAAPGELFRLHEDLPPLQLGEAALLGDGDPLAATLAACTDLLEAADENPGDRPGDSALLFLARAFTIELDDLRKVFAEISPGDRAALVSPYAFGLADRYTLVLAAAACLGVWREQRGGSDPFLTDAAWVTAALYRLGRRLGLPLPDRPSSSEQRVLAEVLARLHGARSYDLYGSALA